MKVTEHINNASKALFSFEVLPPLKGQNIQTLFSNIEPLMEFNPPFIDGLTIGRNTSTEIKGMAY